MEGPDGIQLDELIGATERGTLWRATRQRKGDRIVRIVDPRFCDSRFRQSLNHLRERPQPRMLPIVGEGFAGVHFYIEYRADSPWETLEANFKRLHWRMRLAVMDSICQVLPFWSKSPIHPLGLNERNIIIENNLGRFLPWLLPCPALHYASPCDLFGCDSPVISALAPEVIRGVPFPERTQDIYALGTLAIHALGCKEVRQVVTDEDRVEAQACGALLFCEMKASEIEDFLYDVESLKRLLQVIQRYAHIAPQARPLEVLELQAASHSAVEATKPGTLSLAYVRQQNSRGALKILQWGFDTFGDNLVDRLLAASICEKIEEFTQALKHLDFAVEIKPGDIELRWRRNDLRWRLYQNLPPLSPDEPDLEDDLLILYQNLPPLRPDEPDPEGDLLIKDLNWLKLTSETNPTQRNKPHKRLVAVYRRRNDLLSAAQELFRASELEPADMEALYLYAECFKDLGKFDEFVQTVQVAHERIGKMTKNEMMEETEAQKWRKRFDVLLQS